MNTKAIALVDTEIALKSAQRMTRLVKKQDLSTTPARAVLYAGHGMAKGVNYTDGVEVLIYPKMY
jgi:hypothetical protein